MRTAVILILIALFHAIPSIAQPFFCIDEGTRLVYLRKHADSGEIKWKHTMDIREVVMAEDSSAIVRYSSYFEDKRGKGITKDTIHLSASITEDSDVIVDISASMVAVLKGFLWKGAKVEAEGGKTLLPYSLVPGQTIPEAHGCVSALGMKMNVDVTDRKVIGHETITTPAGTFECTVVSEHKVEKGMMRNRITTAHTWYARGVGMVRHDTYDRNMKLETSEILEKIAIIQ